MAHQGDASLRIPGPEENEVLLYSVVLALRDSLNILLKYVYTEHQGIPLTAPRNSVDKRTVIENYDLVVRNSGSKLRIGLLT